MTSSDLPNIYLAKGLWIDRKIQNFHVPKPNGFFLEPLEKSHFLGEILIIKK